MAFGQKKTIVIIAISTWGILNTREMQIPFHMKDANTVFTLGRNMFRLIINETCFAMKIVHISRCIARIMMEARLF